MQVTGPDGYRGVQILNDDVSWLAEMPGGRRVVLKKIDPDCLVSEGSRLHPHVRDRLARLRELAHPRLVNFHGVERQSTWQDGAPFLIWDFIAGQTLEEWAVLPEVSPAELARVARELLVTVKTLHERGIVHGAIHGRNVIITSGGRVRLTHVSPLLYTDLQNDLDSISALFEDLSAVRGGRDMTTDHPVATVSSPIASPIHTGEKDLLPLSDQRRRRRLRALAVLLVGVAIGAGFGLNYLAHQIWPTSPLSPPRASAAAMSP